MKLIQSLYESVLSLRENQQMVIQQDTIEFNEKTGEQLTPDEFKEVMCSNPDELPLPNNITPEQKQKVDELKEKMKTASFAELLQAKKQIRDLKRQYPQQQDEQVAGTALVTILGISMPPAFAIGIGVIILALILTFMGRILGIKKTTTYFCDGTRSRGLFGLLRW